MKRHLLLILSIIFCSHFITQASEQKVKLKEVSRVGQNQRPSFTGNASLTNRSLTVSFNQRSISCINIIVSGDYGDIVYQNQIPTSEYGTVLVDLEYCSEGEYTIHLENEEGEALEGDFYLE